MTENYQVLARKYRPQDFTTLIGQDVMVQTLSNAIKTGRIAQAFMLTGVRGVGKTTTARIIAKALNCTGRNNDNEVNPCGICENCLAIAKDRHIDVVEVDAASQTGIDNIREIIENVQYKPLSTKYKIYIIDEVHMLSNNAFNALLKTLEEPPSHAKFIFATTEIRKVPITILSRCQRFDLKRISEETLTEHFAKILEKENIENEPLALKLIAKAADGSVRDGLSLLDQAISHSDTKIKADDVANMLGIANKSSSYKILSYITEGKIDTAIEELKEWHKNGGEATQIVQDLMDIIHLITSLHISNSTVQLEDLNESDKTTTINLKNNLSLGVLGRLWQALLKGYHEVTTAPNPLIATEMLLIRISMLSAMPSPEEVLRQLQNKNSSEDTQKKNPEIGNIKKVENKSETIEKNKEKYIDQPKILEETKSNIDTKLDNNTQVDNENIIINHSNEISIAQKELIKKWQEFVNAFSTDLSLKEHKLLEKLKSTNIIEFSKGSLYISHPDIKDGDIKVIKSVLNDKYPNGQPWKVILESDSNILLSLNKMEELAINNSEIIQTILKNFPDAKKGEIKSYNI